MVMYTNMSATSLLFLTYMLNWTLSNKFSGFTLIWYTLKVQRNMWNFDVHELDPVLLHVINHAPSLKKLRWIHFSSKIIVVCTVCVNISMYFTATTKHVSIYQRLRRELWIPRGFYDWSVMCRSVLCTWCS